MATQVYSKEYLDGFKQGGDFNSASSTIRKVVSKIPNAVTRLSFEREPSNRDSITAQLENYFTGFIDSLEVYKRSLEAHCQSESLGAEDRTHLFDFKSNLSLLLSSQGQRGRVELAKYLSSHPAHRQFLVQEQIIGPNDYT